MVHGPPASHPAAPAVLLIRLDRVALHPGRGDRPILWDLDLAVPTGAFRWIVGPSAAGKTALLGLLGLSRLPDAGRMDLLGVPVQRADRPALARLRRRIGTVFQDGRLLPELSVFDNAALPLRLDGKPETRVRADTTELLRWLGLARLLKARPAELSAGERQRVSIARAVLHRPALLLADEPFAVDPEDTGRILDLFADLNRLGSTVLVATRDDRLPRRHPQPTLLLDRGHLLAHD